MIALALILVHPTLEGQVPDNVRQANEEACKDSHYEQALRVLHADYEKQVAGDFSPPVMMNAAFYRMVATMGPAVAQGLAIFQKPKVKSAGGADQIDTWVDAARYRLAGICEEAVYANVRDVFHSLRDGSLKSQGLPTTIDVENATPEDLFFEVIKGTGSANTSFSTSERKFPGLHEDMKGQSCKVSFGWYAGPWRQLSAKAKAAKASKDAAGTSAVAAGVAVADGA